MVKVLHADLDLGFLGKLVKSDVHFQLHLYRKDLDESIENRMTVCIVNVIMLFS